MSAQADRIRELLASYEDEHEAQARELLAAMGDSALYAEILAGWEWDEEEDGELGWRGGGQEPFYRKAATNLWQDAPLDAPFPASLAPGSARRLRVTWRGQAALLPKLRALPRLASLTVWIEQGAPPLPFAALPAGVRYLFVHNAMRPGELAGLEELAGLRHLDLMSCRLRGVKLPPRLASLSLMLCRERTALASLVGDVPLKRLRIHDSSVRVALDGMESLRSLTIHRLERGAFPDLPPLEGLRSLDLENNGLASPPASIGRLPNLRRLALCKSELRTVPPEIGDLSRLQRLDLLNNPLADLPPEIGRLAELRRLDLALTAFEALPPALASLHSLEKLDLSSTRRLMRLPPWLPELYSLEALDLRGSGIEKLPIDSLLALPRLRRLCPPDGLRERAEELARRAEDEQGRRIELCDYPLAAE